jgi:hypothetical protein
MISTAVRGQSQSLIGATVIGAINLFILTCGILLALVALGGMRRHGRRGILWPAVIGIVINLLFIGIIAATWLDYRRKSALRPADHAIPTQVAQAIDYNPPVFSRIISWDSGPSPAT